MKVKKHYNSFHPKLGFFQHLDEVLSWFDAEPGYFKTVGLPHVHPLAYNHGSLSPHIYAILPRFRNSRRHNMSLC